METLTTAGILAVRSSITDLSSMLIEDRVIQNYALFCNECALEDNWEFTLPKFIEIARRTFGGSKTRYYKTNAILAKFYADEKLSGLADVETLKAVKECLDTLSAGARSPPSLEGNPMAPFIDFIQHQYISGRLVSPENVKALASEIDRFGLDNSYVMQDMSTTGTSLEEALQQLTTSEPYIKYLTFVKHLPQAPIFGPLESWLPEAMALVPEVWRQRVGAVPNGLSLDMLMELFPGDEVGAAVLSALYTSVTMHNSQQKPNKPFPLGRSYGNSSIYGLKKRMDRFEVASALVHSLISRDNELALTASELFDSKKIAEARRFTARHSTSRKAVYRSIRPFLNGLAWGDNEATLRVLSVLKETYASPVISDLVAGVESLFLQSNSFDKLVVRAQNGTIDDLFDNRILMACPFFPSGIYKYAALDYLLRPDIALLHIVPVSGTSEGEPIGVAILAFVEDIRGKRYLLVDSVEGGEYLQRIRDSVWKPLVHKAILSFAASVEGLEKEILINYRFTGASSVPRKALDYFLLNSLQKRQMMVRLSHLVETPVYLEAFKDRATHEFNVVDVYVLNAGTLPLQLQKLQVRHAMESDVGAVLSLESSRLPQQQQDPESLERALQSSGINLVCLNPAGVIIGYILSYPVSEKLHIEHVATNENYPCAFLHLLSHLRSEARGNGYKAASLLARKSVGIDGLVERLGGVRLGEEQLGAGELKEAYVRMEVKL